MTRIQRILFIWLIAILLMLTACAMPEHVPTPSLAPTVNPTVAPPPTVTPTPTPDPSPTSTPLQTPPALSKEETIDVLDSFMAELATSIGIEYTTAFDNDIYKVHLTATDSVESLFFYLNDDSLSKEGPDTVLE